MRDVSRICCPSTKGCLLPSNYERENLVETPDSTLAIILYSLVVRFMGQKSATVQASNFFEIKQMYACFIQVAIDNSILKKNFETLMISTSRKVQHLKKKEIEVKPSGLGVLSEPRC